jgi:hypothetical protein
VSSAAKTAQVGSTSHTIDESDVKVITGTVEPAVWLAGLDAVTVAPPSTGAPAISKVAEDDDDS